MFRPLHFAGLFNAWDGKKHVLLTKNMLFYKSAKQSVRHFGVFMVKKRYEGPEKGRKLAMSGIPVSPPEIRKPPQGGFFISADTGRRTRKSHANGVGSTMSKRAKRSAGDLSGMPRSRCFAPCEGVPVSPPKIQRPHAGRLIFVWGADENP